MYDNSQRSLWLEQAYSEICKDFGFVAESVLIGASYPPAGARGDLSRVRPADYDTQWRGNDNEKDGFISIHPMSFRTPFDCAKAILWTLSRKNKGVRHGPQGVGLHKEPNATLTATPETEAKLQAILARIGDPPVGFAEPFPVRNVTRGRMIAYRCMCKSKSGKGYVTVHSAASGLTITCDTCNTQFQQV